MNKVELLEQVIHEDDLPKHWGIIEDTYAIRPIRGGDGRVLILKDDFETRMDCALCKGKGHIDEICPECNGNGRFRGKPEHEDHCTTCYIITDKSQSSIKASVIDLKGKKPCSACDGKGTSSLIIPDESKIKPSKGNVIAVSITGINEVKVNDKVIFTTYTGTQFEFMGQSLVLATEKDLIGIIKKLKATADNLVETIHADLENTGVPHE